MSAEVIHPDFILSPGGNPLLQLVDQTNYVEPISYQQEAVISKSRRNFSILLGFTMLALPSVACGLGGGPPPVVIPQDCLDAAKPKERRAMRGYISNFLSKGFSPAQVQSGINETCAEIKAR